jgi:hypothetical protein
MLKTISMQQYRDPKEPIAKIIVSSLEKEVIKVS